MTNKKIKIDNYTCYKPEILNERKEVLVTVFIGDACLDLTVSVSNFGKNGSVEIENIDAEYLDIEYLPLSKIDLDFLVNDIFEKNNTIMAVELAMKAA